MTKVRSWTNTRVGNGSLLLRKYCLKLRGRARVCIHIDKKKVEIREKTITKETNKRINGNLQEPDISAVLTTAEGDTEIS